MKTWLACAVGAVLLVVGGACSRGEADPAFPNSYSSAEALAAAALVALEAGDREALDSLRVAREEYENLFWAELPESRSLSLNYVWWLNQHNSDRTLDQALAAMTGIGFELRELTFTKGTEEYESFTLHRGARMVVRRVSDGSLGELPLLDVFVERNGRWKLLNYSD